MKQSPGVSLSIHTGADVKLRQLIRIKNSWKKFQGWEKWCDISKINPKLSLRVLPKQKKVFRPIAEIRLEQIENKNVYELKTKSILDSLGIRYTYQMIYGPYVLDFYLPEYRVDLEMDGRFHRKQKEKDKKRTKYLARKNIHTVRFWNSSLSDIPSFCMALTDRLNNFRKPEPLVVEDKLTEEFKRVCAH